MLINLIHNLHNPQRSITAQAKLQTPALPPVTLDDKHLKLLSHLDVIELASICPSRLRNIRIPLPHFIPTTPSHIPRINYIKLLYVQKLQQRYLTSNGTTYNMPQLQPSDPSSVMVIRDITPNITTFSLPFARFGVVKVGGRATLGMFSLSAVPPKAKR